LFGVTTADAGWAGSRYNHGDCSLSHANGRPTLSCRARFTTITPNVTQEILVADALCANGIRTVRRTGTRVDSFVGYDVYNGPAPLAKFNVFGNETDFRQEWRDLVETDLGCT
jgi:hypothetical protein